MLKNKVYKSLASTALLAATMTANAKVESFNVGFVTIQDLSITQQQGLSFGQNVIGKAGTSCTIYTALTGTGTALVVAADVDDGIEGTGCLTQGGGSTPTAVSTFAGLYHITGAASQSVNVTVASTSTADFDFSPSGKLVTQGTAFTAGSTSLFADSPASATLGTTGNAGLSLILGGSLTVGAADLSANTPYSGSFDITAVY